MLKNCDSGFIKLMNQETIVKVFLTLKSTNMKVRFVATVCITIHLAVIRNPWSYPNAGLSKNVSSTEENVITVRILFVIVIGPTTTNSA